VWPVVTGVAALLVVALCILSSSPMAASQDETEAALYAQQCGACHGAEGEGGIGPDLRALTSAADVAAKIRAGGGGMPAFEGVLSEAQIEALAGWVVEELGAAPGDEPTPPTDETPPPGESPPPADGTPSPTAEPSPSATAPAPPLAADASGAQIYSALCAPCHGARGEGGSGPSLAAAAFAGIVAPKVRVGGGGMPAFGDTLTADQVGRVSTYVAEEVADAEARSATVPEGGEVYRLYCAGCHGATGRGGALTTGVNAPSFAGIPAANALSAMLVGPGNMPSLAGALDSRQQAAVSRYVELLLEPPAPGGHGLWFIGPFVEGAVSWVAAGVLVLVSIWLARGRRGARDE
jgi:ubiquinol-cytochrome c reductase cytochrome c subunit